MHVFKRIGNEVKRSGKKVEKQVKRSGKDVERVLRPHVQKAVWESAQNEWSVVLPFLSLHGNFTQKKELRFFLSSFFIGLGLFFSKYLLQ